jgi:hypothetical protein
VDENRQSDGKLPGVTAVKFVNEAGDVMADGLTKQCEID